MHTFEETAPSRVGPVPGARKAVNLPATNAAGQFALTLFNKRMSQLSHAGDLGDGGGRQEARQFPVPRVLTADQVEATIEDGQEIPVLVRIEFGGDHGFLPQGRAVTQGSSANHS